MRGAQLLAAQLLALLLLLLAAPSAFARHTFAQIRKDDRSLIIIAQARCWGGAVAAAPRLAAAPPTPRPPAAPPLVQPFGFGEDGRMNITVSNFALWKLGTASAKASGYHRCAAGGSQRRLAQPGGGGCTSSVQLRAATAPARPPGLSSSRQCPARELWWRD